MSWRRRTYVIHRWIGLVVALQLLAWSSGGLYFTLFHNDRIVGTSDARERPPVALDPARVGVAPSEALARAGAGGTAVAEVTSVVLRAEADGTPVYELRRGEDPVAVVDARDGALRPQVTRDQAEAIARADFAHDAPVVDVQLITKDAPMEFRLRRLPAWAVTLDHPRSPRLYIDAVTGEVVVRRNTVWRVFDFFWMLHVMDYSERENFHHPLLTVMAALAVLTAASGIALWVWRLLPPARPRPRPAG